uniref:Reverse transcriptase domain-containing protein n=1 Tax=Lactuca sativa TaxID=4236 RepID=A0A9R1VNI0_LACSA|nr:hypothetical protein LSAT_V11C400181190 [Lactuca sativa]
MANFNEVRVARERYGPIFHPHATTRFNDFIADAGLFDIPLGGYSFTWSDRAATKMSKLDRFLVSKCTLEIFPNLTCFVLERHLSDHHPIILKGIYTEYDPSPFRVFHSWFSIDDFVQIMEDSWNNNEITHSNALVLLKKKLQHLKKMIKVWNSKFRNNKDGVKNKCLLSFADLESKIDRGEGDPSLLVEMVVLIKKIDDFNRHDGFSFGFIRRFWYLIDKDVIHAVVEFFSSSEFPIGCNSSFIALIPKMGVAFLSNLLSLYVSFLEAMYGNSGYVGENTFPSKRSNWVDIVKAVNQIRDIDVYLLQLCTKKIGDDTSTSFWDDVWLGGLVLKDQFHRIYNLENYKGIRVKEKLS